MYSLNIRYFLNTSLSLLRFERNVSDLWIVFVESNCPEWPGVNPAPVHGTGHKPPLWSEFSCLKEGIKRGGGKEMRGEYRRNNSYKTYIHIFKISIEQLLVTICNMLRLSIGCLECMIMISYPQDIIIGFISPRPRASDIKIKRSMIEHL